jgi:hypothetical protein
MARVVHAIVASKGVWIKAKTDVLLVCKITFVVC